VEHSHGGDGRHASGHYQRLLIMTGVSFLAMYALMYAMVNDPSDVFNSLNETYMAGLMTGAMLVIELGVMFGMYPNRRLNVALLIVGAAALAVCWVGIRRQVGIGDRQFLRSMIPHHAGAILMCRHAALSDEQVRQLCRGIISGQQREIDEMKAILGKAK
jgi:hypothetical protein